MSKVNLTTLTGISATLFLVSLVAVNAYLADANTPDLSPKQSETMWGLSLFRNISFWCFSFLAVVASLCRFNSSRNRHYLICSVLAIGGNALFIGYMFYTASQLIDIPQKAEYSEFSDPQFLVEYREFLNSGHESLQAHISLTTQIASAFYEYTGEIIDVVDENGDVVPYTPTSENQEFRKQDAQVIALIANSQKQAKRAGVIQVILLLTALFFGLVLSRFSNYKRKNNKSTRVLR